VRLKVVPLWVIPPRNSKGELFAEEKEQPAPTVTNPVKRLFPELLLSVIDEVPAKVVAPPAVKFEVPRFNEPVPLREIVPVRLTVPVELQFTEPAMVEDPVTV